MRKFALLMALALTFSLPVGTMVHAMEGAPAAETEAAAEFNTGVFKGTAPAGWKFFPGKKDDTLIAEQGSVFKGAQSEADLKKTAGIDIKCMKKDEYTPKDTKALYENTTDVEFETKGKKWKGFSGEYNRVQNIILECDDQECHWSVIGVTETDISSFTAEDQDFRDLLASLEYVSVKEVKEHVHNFVYSYTVDVSCLADGYDVYVCPECSEYEVRDYKNAIGHNWERIGGGASSCTVPGAKVYRCVNCDDVYEEELELIPHDFQYNYTEYGTCVDEGFDVYNCTMCGDADYRNPTPPTGVHGFYYEQCDSVYHNIRCAYCDYFAQDIHHQSGEVCVECGFTGAVG